jgi:thioredoxin-related protein
LLQLQPELADLKEQGIDLYVIAAGLQKDLAWFFDQVELEATVVHDTDYTIFQKYSIVSIPTLLLIDKEGKAAFAHVGWGTNSFEQHIEPLLLELLAE